MTQPPFDALFAAMRSVKVGVIGDVMLDSYMWGHVERISPEAPVPVVALDRKEYRVGGAANVALNIAALGAPVSLLSVVGDDEDGRILTQLLQQHGIQTGFLRSSNRRITTNKTRIISRNQQMLRLDNEITTDLDAEDEERLLQAVRQFIEQEQPQVLIFEDYNKGVLTPRVIEHTLALCREGGILTTVDPKRRNFFAYRQADVFKPNLKEVKEALHLDVSEINLDTLNHIHDRLQQQLHHRISLITLSEKGVFVRETGGAGKLFPAHVRNIADVSGAGDTVIAVASLVYAVTRNLELMTTIANIAGGLVCEEVGTAAINPQRLLQECNTLLA
ncbi:MAG: bifunctional heptose 7-phosphate kinase/heptose 1-phosphate adenyltransferase [Lacibacter sp.]